MLVTSDMKCPNCGSDNRAGAKYCSECAERLPEAPAIITVHTNVDDKLSDELVELWRLYEINDFDIALEKIADIKRNLSGSSSIYSMAALIYEKRARFEYDRGDIAGYYDDLGNAAKEYEEVVKQNPHSAADRAKLLALRHKLLASADEVLGTSQPKWTFIKKIPLPIWVAAAVFIVVLTALAITSSRNRGQDTAEVVYPTQVSTPQYAAPANPSMYPQYQAPPATGRGGVYTFPPVKPQQSQTPPPSAQERPVRPQYESGYDRPLPTLEPLKVDVVPSNNSKNKPSTANRTNSPTVSINNNSGNGSAATVQPQPYQDTEAEDPDTWLARAIDFEKQGHYDMARAAADRALRLFQRNVADGRNAAAGENGIELAKDLIKKLENKK